MILFSQPGPQNHVSATLTSNEIEDEYQSDSSRVVSFSTPSDKYELKFKQMRQTNIQSETERLVRRRPDPRGFQDNIHVAVSDDNPANDQVLRKENIPVNESMLNKIARAPETSIFP